MVRHSGHRVRAPADPFQRGADYNARLNLLLMWLEVSPVHVPTTLNRDKIYQCNQNRLNGYLPSEQEEKFIQDADVLRVQCCNKSLRMVKYDWNRALKELRRL